MSVELRPSASMFGGEPLMVAAPDLEALWAWGFRKFGRNGIQTTAR
jgi:uncharacterized protein